MTPSEYNKKASSELRAAHMGPRGLKVPANLERDLARLASRYVEKHHWRGEIDVLAEIWAKIIYEFAGEAKRQKRKGRRIGILTWQEKAFADVAIFEVRESYRAVKAYAEVAALAAPNPRKRGLTVFRNEILERAMAIAKEHNYLAQRARMIEEIRKQLREPEPIYNYLATGPRQPRRIPKKI
jgi:hypothetical protein